MPFSRFIPAFDMETTSISSSAGMKISMKAVVFLDDPAFSSLVKTACSMFHSTVLIASRDLSAAGATLPENVSLYVTPRILSRKVFASIQLEQGDTVLLCFSDGKRLIRCIELIRERYPEKPPIFVITLADTCKLNNKYNNVFHLQTDSIVGNELLRRIRKAENLMRIDALQNINRTAGRILILLQNDPDPDALAAGLALRTLFGRNKQTAPLGSFGEVTRSENLNMIRLLDIPVIKVKKNNLASYSAIAMVDVQPAYFKKDCISADIVIDHHPTGNDTTGAAFEDVRVSYGASSTILGQYLMDSGFKITSRLATALVYGIKTDTLFLDRGISAEDVEVFTHLYPLANINMLRQIEHPALEYREIHDFVKALKHSRIVHNMLFAYLGHTETEDIIPRLADFCLQIGGAEWSFVTGIAGGNVVCSVRNAGYVQHAGELLQKVFGHVGSAGGHRSSAKAVIDFNMFKKYYSINRLNKMQDCVIKLIIDAAGMS